MDELTQDERALLASWRTMTPSAGLADRVISARAGHRRRWVAMTAAVLVAAAAAVVLVLAPRPDTTLDRSRPVAPVTSPIAGNAPPKPAPAPRGKDVVVTLPLHSARPGAHPVRVFDTNDASAIVFRVDLAGSRCASWPVRSVFIDVTPGRGEVRLLENAGSRLTLDSELISLPRGTYKVDVKCSGMAETNIEVETFDVSVVKWVEPRDEGSIDVHLDPNRPFEITYSNSIPPITIGEDRNEFEFDVHDLTHANLRPNRRRQPDQSFHTRADLFLLKADADYDVDVRRGKVQLGKIVIRRDLTAAHFAVKTVSQHATERDLQFSLLGEGDWRDMKTDSPRGRFNCPPQLSCRLTYFIFAETDFPIFRALSNSELGDQYYVIR